MRREFRVGSSVAAGIVVEARLERALPSQASCFEGESERKRTVRARPRARGLARSPPFVGEPGESPLLVRVRPRQLRPCAGGCGCGEAGSSAERRRLGSISTSIDWRLRRCVACLLSANEPYCDALTWPRGKSASQGMGATVRVKRAASESVDGDPPRHPGAAASQPAPPLPLLPPHTHLTCRPPSASPPHSPLPLTQPPLLIAANRRDACRAIRPRGVVECAGGCVWTCSVTEGGCCSLALLWGCSTFELRRFECGDGPHAPPPWWLPPWPGVDCLRCGVDTCDDDTCDGSAGQCACGRLLSACMRSLRVA